MLNGKSGNDFLVWQTSFCPSACPRGSQYRAYQQYSRPHAMPMDILLVVLGTNFPLCLPLLVADAATEEFLLCARGEHGTLLISTVCPRLSLPGSSRFDQPV